MTFLKNKSFNLQVCKIEFAEISDIESLNCNTHLMVIVWKQGKSWHQFYFTPGKCTFSSDQVNDAAGPYFNNKVTIQFPGEDLSTISDIDNFENKRFILKITLNSGDFKIIGDFDSPCTCQNNLSTEKAGRVFEFLQKSVLPIPNFVE